MEQNQQKISWREYIKQWWRVLPRVEKWAAITVVITLAGVIATIISGILSGCLGAKTCFQPPILPANTPIVTTVPVPITQLMIEITEAGAAIHSDASKNPDTVIQSFPLGTQFPVFGIFSKAWYCISYKGKPAWIVNWTAKVIPEGAILKTLDQEADCKV